MTVGNSPLPVLWALLGLCPAKVWFVASDTSGELITPICALAKKCGVELTRKETIVGNDPHSPVAVRSALEGAGDADLAEWSGADLAYTAGTKEMVVQTWRWWKEELEGSEGWYAVDQPDGPELRPADGGRAVPVTPSRAPTIEEVVKLHRQDLSLERCWRFARNAGVSGAIDDSAKTAMLAWLREFLTRTSNDRRTNTTLADHLADALVETDAITPPPMDWDKWGLDAPPAAYGYDPPSKSTPKWRPKYTVRVEMALAALVSSLLGENSRCEVLAGLHFKGSGGSFDRPYLHVAVQDRLRFRLLAFFPGIDIEARDPNSFPTEVALRNTFLADQLLGEYAETAIVTGLSDDKTAEANRRLPSNVEHRCRIFSLNDFCFAAGQAPSGPLAAWIGGLTT